jgi:hypothetical protein
LKLIYLLFDLVEAVYHILFVGAAESCAAVTAYDKMDCDVAGLKSNLLQLKQEASTLRAFYHTNSPFALLSEDSA